FLPGPVPARAGFGVVRLLRGTVFARAGFEAGSCMDWTWRGSVFARAESFGARALPVPRISCPRIAVPCISWHRNTGPVRMSITKHAFIVIGSGPAGRRAAIQAAKLGRSVLVVEKGRRVGGVSVHTGTIPSKTLRETVLNLTGYRERGFYGRAYRVKKDIQSKDLMARLHMTLDHEVDVLEHQFARNGVETMLGTARFRDSHHVEVTLDNGDIRVVEGEKFLIAVGTRPHRPADVPFNRHNVLDSDEIVGILHLPRSLTVVGGGVIGVEYATIFSALDVQVTLI